MEDAEDMANKEDNVVNGDGASDDDDSDEHQVSEGSSSSVANDYFV